MNNEQRIKFALVAIAEARLLARQISGDAANVAPTPAQLARITMADMGGEGFAQAKAALEDFEKKPLATMLYSCEGGYPMAAIVAEIKSALYA